MGNSFLYVTKGRPLGNKILRHAMSHKGTLVIVESMLIAMAGKMIS